MAKLKFDETGTRFYETGISQVALFPKTSLSSGKYTYANGVAWNGVTSISENPSGAEATAQYADNIKYLNLVSNEDFALSIEAFAAPKEFAPCDGKVDFGNGMVISQQKRREFGIVYKTILGNDSENNDYGYKLHIVWNCLAAPSQKAYNTVNESPEAMTLSWEVSTTPEKVTGLGKPTAHLEIASTAAKIADVEAVLYGTDGTSGKTPTLPTPDEIIAILAAE